MSDRIVAHTVIRMTLALFRANDTHLKKKIKSPYPGDYCSYSNVIVHRNRQTPVPRT